MRYLLAGIVLVVLLCIAVRPEPTSQREDDADAIDTIADDLEVTHETDRILGLLRERSRLMRKVR
jgi:hypothetical protein